MHRVPLLDHHVLQVRYLPIERGRYHETNIRRSHSVHGQGTVSFRSGNIDFRLCVGYVPLLHERIHVYRSLSYRTWRTASIYSYGRRKLLQYLLQEWRRVRNDQLRGQVRIVPKILPGKKLRYVQVRGVPSGVPGIPIREPIRGLLGARGARKIVHGRVPRLQHDLRQIDAFAALVRDRHDR